MFERIKMRIIQGGKLKPFATAKVLQDHEDRLRALEGETSSSDETPDNQTPSKVPETRDISFSITNSNAPVEGATVTIGETTGTTGSAGGCTLKDIPDGEHTVTVSGTNITTKTETITTSVDNTSFTIEIEFTPVPEGT